MKGKLPDSILNRKKAGLDIPAHEWFRGPLLPLLRDTLHSGSDPQHRFVRCRCNRIAHQRS